MAAQPQEIDRKAPVDIDRRIYDLYDEYCHGKIDRREFLARASALVIGGARDGAGLFPRYAQAQTISFTDERIKAKYVEYPSPGGTSGEMRGYLVQPARQRAVPGRARDSREPRLEPVRRGRCPARSHRGLPRARAGRLAPVGGYPGNDDDGRTLQASLDQAKLRQDMVNSARYLKSHELSTGKLGATGFCWGGGMVNNLAVAIGADLARRRAVLRRRGGDGRRAEDQGAADGANGSTDERINAM